MKLKLSHILVKHQYEAEDLLRQLESGRDFGELARRHSQCPSRQNDGSLGEVELRRLDATFAEAAQRLAENEISPIVRTPFGYHLIQRHSFN